MKQTRDNERQHHTPEPPKPAYSATWSKRVTPTTSSSLASTTNFNITPQNPEPHWTPRNYQAPWGAASNYIPPSYLRRRCSACIGFTSNSLRNFSCSICDSKRVYKDFFPPPRWGPHNSLLLPFSRLFGWLDSKCLCHSCFSNFFTIFEPLPHGFFLLLTAIWTGGSFQGPTTFFLGGQHCSQPAGEGLKDRERTGWKD